MSTIWYNVIKSISRFGNLVAQLLLKGDPMLDTMLNKLPQKLTDNIKAVFSRFLGCKNAVAARFSSISACSGFNHVIAKKICVFFAFFGFAAAIMGGIFTGYETTQAVIPVAAAFRSEDLDNAPQTASSIAESAAPKQAVSQADMTGIDTKNESVPVSSKELPVAITIKQPSEVEAKDENSQDAPAAAFVPSITHSQAAQAALREQEAIAKRSDAQYHEMMASTAEAAKPQSEAEASSSTPGEESGNPNDSETSEPESASGAEETEPVAQAAVAVNANGWVQPANASIASLPGGFIYSDKIPMSRELQEYTYNKCVERGLEYELILAIIWRESRFTPNAVNYNTNGTRDSGIMQINDVNRGWLAEQHGITNLMDPYENINAGTTMLGSFTYKYGSHYALLAYQYGEAGMRAQVARGNTTNRLVELVYSQRDYYRQFV